MNADTKKRYKDIDFPYECPVTKRIFTNSKGLSVYITKTLKMDKSIYYDEYINHRDSSCFFCGDKGEFISVAKGYRNLCNKKTCIEKSFKSHSVEGIMYRKLCSKEEAEKLFEIYNKEQLEKRTETNNSLREKDPLWDKKRSRNCKEFWIEKGYSEKEAIGKSKEVMDEIHRKIFKKFKDNPEKYASKQPTRIEYYLKKGYSEEESKKLLSERQATFSKEICIEKHGVEKGTKIWLDRQDKWLNNMNSKSEEEKAEINRKKLSGAQYSPISQKLLWDVYKRSGTHKSKFGELNAEFYLQNKNNKWFAYDYVDTYKKKCIEFNGDFWHCNPKKYKKDYIHRVRGVKASKVWDNDKNKINLIKSKGYKVLVIWESDYKKNPKETLEKCLNFLNN